MPLAHLLKQKFKLSFQSLGPFYFHEYFQKTPVFLPQSFVYTSPPLSEMSLATKISLSCLLALLVSSLLVSTFCVKVGFIGSVGPCGKQTISV